jgi:ceramide glucosyltransferase
MGIAEFSAASAAALTAGQLLSVGLAAFRCRRRRGTAPAPPHAPGITLARPLRGIEGSGAETLEASFHLTYPVHEVLFCVADANDPVIPLIRAALAAHPRVDARLLVGDERLGANPKLNNMAKAWREAKHGLICFADSNLLTPPDYLERVLAEMKPGVGAVSAPPVGVRPEGFWSNFECAFLNTFEARWQYAVDTLGFGFCQGKTLFFAKSLLGGRGLAALTSEPAEDAALTNATRARGLCVKLAGPPFAQPVGARAAQDVWSRQVRWARLRRATFPLHYAPEIVLGFWPAALALAGAADLIDAPLWACELVLLAAWYGCEAALAALAGWPLSWSFMAASALRDLCMPALWVAAWIGDGFDWHGNSLSANHAKLGPDANVG